MRALDAIEGGWILFIFVLAFFWYPARLFSRESNSDRLMRVAGNLVRAVLGVTLAAFVLNSLHALNAITVILLFLLPMTAVRFFRNSKRPVDGWRSMQKGFLGLVRQLETWSPGGRLLPRSRLRSVPPTYRPAGANSWLGLAEGKQLLVACLAAVLVTTCILATGHALRELRPDQPGQYDALLHARELTLGLHESVRPMVFPAIIATASLLSGRDAMQVTRFLAPVVSVLLVLVAGLLVRVCTRSDVASVAAMYCLGAASFPVAAHELVAPLSPVQKLWSMLRTSPAQLRPTPEFTLGLIFLLLAMAFIVDWYRNARGTDSLLDFACCLLLAAAVSRTLGLILVIGAGAVLLEPTLGLIIFLMVGYGLAAYLTLATTRSDPAEALAVLPVAAAVGAGCVLAFIQTRVLSRLGQTAETVVLVACIAAAFVWFRPQRLPVQCLEYETAAQVTERIAQQFPRQSWMVAAPVEQLAETLGWGAHEDLAWFVEKYQGQVDSPGFRFPDEQNDLFVYVEKRPFQIFVREPEAVSFSVLSDGTYRSYRSPGGRASLESAAFKLCESYRQHHSDADIFFENEDLRIYHIHQQQLSESSRAGE